MKAPKLRAPIVLVHGIFGFTEIRMAGLKLANYFANIPGHLCGGNHVLVPRLSATGAIAFRAAQLKAYLDRVLPNEPVHIFAHSMGGLDARYMISRLGMGCRVLTLTTLGTPHRGSPFADWALGRFERILKPLLQLLCVPVQGFYDLTVRDCRQFNMEVPDTAAVRYFSVAARYDGHFLTPEWLLPAQIVRDAEGPNDGVVSLASAAYGEVQDVWEGDHLTLINWCNPLIRVSGGYRDQAPRYGNLVGRLKDLGF